jgi:hypothetical protein
MSRNNNNNNFNLSGNSSTMFNTLNANNSSQTQYQTQTSGSTDLDDSSPILLQVVASSLNETIPMDSIRIDQIASSAPFSLKALTYVNVTVVDKSVEISFIYLVNYTF